ncbi:MAG: hypothetical protein ABGF52_08390 [Candidatus Asgardarchaeum sp.]
MYKEIYSAWKKEKECKEIRPLQRDFFDRVSDYINSLKNEISEADNEILKELKKRELKYVLFMIQELILRRFKKIMRYIFDENEKPDFERLTDFELKITVFLLEISHILEKVIDSISKGERISLDQGIPSIVEIKEEKIKPIRHDLELTKEACKEYIIVRIKQDLPEITGVDLNTYGPFKRGDIAKLPKENANLLINDGLAEQINLEEKLEDE